jgi:hypothetical protein
MRNASCLTRSVIHLSAAAAAVALLLATAPARAESVIKHPGDHPDYSVELEPHGVFQWGQSPDWMGNDGFGLGFRASIPFLRNGPIQRINNNMAIGFGLDWAHFSNDWWCYGGRPYTAWPNNYGCTANSLWFPVVLQWNFFLTDVISVFGEPGLAIVHDWWSGWQYCNNPNNPYGACQYTWSDTYFQPFVFWAGARFIFGKVAGITVRLGWPSITLGASFLL